MPHPKLTRATSTNGANGNVRVRRLDNDLKLVDETIREYYGMKL